MRLSALVVNCAEIQREDFMKMLQGTRLAQFSFTEASSLSDGLAKVDPVKTDVIFIEWDMSEAIGLDFIRKIRTKLPWSTSYRISSSSRPTAPIHCPSASGTSSR